MSLGVVVEEGEEFAEVVAVLELDDGEGTRVI